MKKEVAKKIMKNRKKYNRPWNQSHKHLTYYLLPASYHQYDLSSFATSLVSPWCRGGHLLHIKPQAATDQPHIKNKQPTCEPGPCLPQPMSPMFVCSTPRFHVLLLKNASPTWTACNPHRRAFLLEQSTAFNRLGEEGCNTHAGEGLTGDSPTRPSPEKPLPVPIVTMRIEP